MRSLGWNGEGSIDHRCEGVHEIGIFLVVNPEAASALTAEVALARTSVRMFVAAIFHAGVMDLDVFLTDDFERLKVGTDVNSVSSTSVLFAANAAIAKLVGIEVFRFNAEFDSLALARAF